MTIVFLRNAWRTPDGTVIESKNRWDYQQHVDAVTGETYFCDGMEFYIRTSINKVPAEDLCVTTEDPFDEQRTYFMWTSWYDAGGERLDQPVRRPLKYLSKEHIQAILNTQKHIKGTYVEDLMLKELEYRKKIDGCN